MNTSAMRIRAFRQLHEAGCFVIPNPWDLGSAKLLAQIGFRALATSSSAFAWSHGVADGHVSLEATLTYLRSLTEAIALPISADLADGFGAAPDAVFTHVALTVPTGIAGLSIEDSTGDAHEPLYDFSPAVDRIRAARQAIDESGTDLVLTARSEGFIVNRPDLAETIRRLVAFADAGADCLFAPGLRTLADIRAVVTAVAPRPVNVLVGSNFSSVAELADAGVRRISVGGALARVAWTGVIHAAQEIANAGTFTALGGAMTFPEINGRFDRGGRG